MLSVRDNLELLLLCDDNKKNHFWKLAMGDKKNHKVLRWMKNESSYDNMSLTINQKFHRFSVEMLYSI